MQAPSSFEGLGHALAGLGYESPLVGLVNEPASKEKLTRHIEWVFQTSPQTRQDRLRRDRALLIVAAFPWGLLHARSALHAARQLLRLRSRKPSKIMRMTVLDEAEDGTAKTVEVTPASALKRN